MDLALRILSDVFCIALGCYISVLRDKNKQLSDIVRKGRWINPSMADFTAYECSACGSFVHVPTVCGEPLYSFCPHCGATINNAKEGTV